MAYSDTLWDFTAALPSTAVRHGENVSSLLSVTSVSMLLPGWSLSFDDESLIWSESGPPTALMWCRDVLLPPRLRNSEARAAGDPSEARERQVVLQQATAQDLPVYRVRRQVPARVLRQEQVRQVHWAKPGTSLPVLLQQRGPASCQVRKAYQVRLVRMLACLQLMLQLK